MTPPLSDVLIIFTWNRERKGFKFWISKRSLLDTFWILMSNLDRGITGLFSKYLRIFTLRTIFKTQQQEKRLFQSHLNWKLQKKWTLDISVRHVKTLVWLKIEQKTVFHWIFKKINFNECGFGNEGIIIEMHFSKFSLVARATQVTHLKCRWTSGVFIVCQTSKKSRRLLRSMLLGSFQKISNKIKKSSRGQRVGSQTITIKVGGEPKKINWQILS